MAVEIDPKKKCNIEFLYTETIAFTDIHRCILKIDRDQTVDVSTAQHLEMAFSIGANSDMCIKRRFRRFQHI